MLKFKIKIYQKIASLLILEPTEKDSILKRYFQAENVIFKTELININLLNKSMKMNHL